LSRGGQFAEGEAVVDWGEREVDAGDVKVLHVVFDKYN
jgi:hypothetical protein